MDVMCLFKDCEKWAHNLIKPIPYDSNATQQEHSRMCSLPLSFSIVDLAGRWKRVIARGVPEVLGIY